MENRQTQTVSTGPATRLQRRKLIPGADFFNFALRVNSGNWNRMKRVLAWGEVTQFINDAIREKLDRDHPEPLPKSRK